MRVVELADELGLRTMDALDLCAFAGIRVSDGSSELSQADAQQARDRYDAWWSPAPAVAAAGGAPPGSGAGPRVINGPPPRPKARSGPRVRDRRGLLSQANWSMYLGVGGFWVPFVPAVLALLLAVPVLRQPVVRYQRTPRSWNWAKRTGRSSHHLAWWAVGGAVASLLLWTFIVVQNTRHGRSPLS